LLQYQNDHERARIDQWLSAEHSAAKQSNFFSRRQDGTGQWLLDSPEYQTWITGQSSTLFCPGIPGAGKTIISSLVINSLRSKFLLGRSKTGVAFLYCDYRTRKTHSDVRFPADLLAQLLRELPVLPERIRQLAKTYDSSATHFPTTDDIVTALKDVVGSFSKVCFVVDALDECSDSSRAGLLAQLFKLRDECGVSIFATSRPHIVEILERFDMQTMIEIRANDSDVDKYVEGNISLLRRFVQEDIALQAEIKTAIRESVKGM
jgi:hypothetical protein